MKRGIAREVINFFVSNEHEIQKNGRVVFSLPHERDDHLLHNLIFQTAKIHNLPA